MPQSISAFRQRRQRGSTILEFSFVLLPLVALLFLTLDLAWVIFVWASLQEGVREGVRSAIIGQTDANIAAVVQKYSFGFAKNSGGKSPVQVFYYSSSNPSQSLSGSGTSCSGNIVKVVVSGISVLPLAPLWRSSSPITLGAAAADIVEGNSTCR